jgi:hypothetical protein
MWLLSILATPLLGNSRKRGGFRRFFKARGAISFFPSHQPFSGRLKVERGVFANVLFLALDPVFVSRIAEGLELDSDRIELVEQRRSTDPTLRHIALALQAGVQSGDAVDRMCCREPGSGSTRKIGGEFCCLDATSVANLKRSVIHAMLIFVSSLRSCVS